MLAIDDERFTEAVDAAEVAMEESSTTTASRRRRRLVRTGDISSNSPPRAERAGHWLFKGRHRSIRLDGCKRDFARDSLAQERADEDSRCGSTDRVDPVS